MMTSIFGPALAGYEPGLETGDAGAGQAGGGIRGDGVPRWTLPIEEPPFAFGEGDGGPACRSGDSNPILASIMQSLSALVAQIVAYFGGAANATPSPGGMQMPFATATASSTGDPHDAFAGTGAAGDRSARFDDEGARANLLSSDSFAGGYRIATTSLERDGKRYNGSASVLTDGGSTAVRMDAGGAVSIERAGEAVAIEPGQTLALGTHESATLAADRSLTVVDAARGGGSISTVLAPNEAGVDVRVSAGGVDLGGFLVDRSKGIGS